ncbi:Serpin family protein [Dioscorea alata]|uniref:Serpin family protein n=1 Tax=Dioscorea alata TaxID=55571 RepID=A0ACB7WQP5_DIOAL|nr:Serpin family protein [Dioscorea alata]
MLFIKESKDSCLSLAERVGSEAITNGSNFVFSPLSIRAALSLAAVGSRAATLDRMLSFLGSGSVEELNAVSVRLLGTVRLNGTDEPGSISFVNGIWVDRSVGMNPVFEVLAQSVYGAAAESVDIQTKPLEVAKEVNGWVEKETNGLIKDLLPDGSVDSNTRLIIANALYFKGLWEHKFDISITREEEFHLLDNTIIKAPFMTSKEDQFITSFDGFQVLRLPYRKHQDTESFSMYIYLSDDLFGLHRLLEKVANEPSFVSNHIPSRRVKVGRFMIPKFKFSYGFEVSKVLKSLGLELPFNENADFSGMSLSSSSADKLFISSVHHKATIEVEEEGTVAAAATGLVFRQTSYIPRVNFVVDHPFMFVIREDVTGALLFFGVVVNPLLSTN